MIYGIKGLQIIWNNKKNFVINPDIVYTRNLNINHIINIDKHNLKVLFSYSWIRSVT